MVNKLVGIILGVVYVVVGLLGFTVAGNGGFASTDGGLLLGIFEINPLHNVVHIAVGALLLIGGLAGVRAAKGVNTLVGVVYLLVGVVGLFLLDSMLNILALNSADNVLHLASAVLLLIVGLAADRSSARVTA
ncbi:MAG: DUF4383 domain-containing protein [Pseudonocardiaceae bacterium]